MISPPQLNEHNKEEYPPMHTAEHLLNQTMIRMFGCGRSSNAHIERKKSKISYNLPECPSEEKINDITAYINQIISKDLLVSYEFVSIDQLPKEIMSNRLPENASNIIRLVRIGDYDVCTCIGKHVEHTSQIGIFKLLGTNWDEEKKSFRIRFKLEGTNFSE